MNSISQSRSSSIGWVMILLALAAVLVVANAPMPTSAPQLASAAVLTVADADPLEEGEPMAAEPVGATSIGPRADETYNIPGLGDVLAGQHAEERHGVEALQARLAMQSGGYNRYDCKDGRTRFVKQLAAHAFAIIIIQDGFEISAFISERNGDAIRRLIERDGCLPPGSPFGGALAN